ncbi:MAG: hypothetical protein FWD18_09700 [Micrococcales bacterium]|nr:hypothetical protein [Micrococcales bacterium]
MRAGAYAVWRGEVFASKKVNSSVYLYLPSSRPCPEGFEKHPQRGWSRKVHISEVERRFSVTTTAVWRGHRVDVRYVEDNKAAIIGKSDRPGDAPKHPSILVEPYGDWQVLVPVYELTEVVERYHESI